LPSHDRSAKTAYGMPVARQNGNEKYLETSGKLEIHSVKNQYQ